MTMPEIGETVLVVRQARWELAHPAEPETLIGRRAAAADKCVNDKDNSTPYWWTFESGMPQRGTGILVVRGGKFEQGPHDWDTSD